MHCEPMFMNYAAPSPSASTAWPIAPSPSWPDRNRLSTSSEMLAIGIGKGAQSSTDGDGPGSTSLHRPHATAFNATDFATPTKLADHIRALVPNRQVNVQRLATIAVANILPRTSFKLAVQEDGLGVAAIWPIQEPFENTAAVYRGEPWGRGPAVAQYGPLPTPGAEQSRYAHIADKGVYTSRHFTCALFYPQALNNPLLTSRSLLTGELAAEDCPRAVRLILQFAHVGPPMHVVKRPVYHQYVFRPEQLTLTHIIVVGAHGVMEAQEYLLRTARAQRANLIYRRHLESADVANRLSALLLRHAELSLAADHLEIVDLRRRQKGANRARHDEAARTITALASLAFVHWEGVAPDRTPHGAWPRDSDTSSGAWLYRADRHRAAVLAASTRSGTSAPSSKAASSSSSRPAADSQASSSGSRSIPASDPMRTWTDLLEALDSGADADILRSTTEAPRGPSMLDAALPKVSTAVPRAVASAAKVAASAPPPSSATSTSEAPSSPNSPTSVAEAPVTEAPGPYPNPPAALGVRSKEEEEAPSSPASIAEAPRTIVSAKPARLAAPPMFAATASVPASTVARVKRERSRSPPRARKAPADPPLTQAKPMAHVLAKTEALAAVTQPKSAVAHDAIGTNSAASPSPTPRGDERPASPAGA